MNTAKNIYSTTMIIQAIVWIFLSIFYFLERDSNTIIIILMVLNGICFFGLGLLTGEKLLFKITIYVFISINLILTVTDQMGFYDYIVLVLNVIALTSFFIYQKIFKLKQIS